MKFKSDPKYAQIAMYSFLVFTATILFYLFVVEFSYVMGLGRNIMRILLPITIGMVMAYLFNFFLVAYETKLLSRTKLKHQKKRLVGILLTYFTVFLLVILFLEFILPQLMESITGIINDLPSYISEFSKFLDNLAESLHFDDAFNAYIIDEVNKLVTYFLRFTTGLIPFLGSLILKIISSIWNIVIGLIVSIYLLADKERFIALTKKVTFATLPKHVAQKTLKIGALTDQIFGNFISGKILDSAIVGVLTFVLLFLFKMPYALLISFIIAVTNIIPFFGPFIGAVPAFFIIMFVSVNQAFIFLILIVLIQQIDGNYIGPKILGDSLGISAFWILFSLLVAGKLFGFLGMLIGVPVFVLIYTLVKEILEARLKKKNLPTETDDYR